MTAAIGARASERLRTYVASRFGLVFDETKRAFLGEVLRERFTRTGLTDTSGYFELLEGASERACAERRALTERLTVTETYFFRYQDHCRAFAELVLPSLARARVAVRTLRILSAGSSSGEEAYTLAMLIRDHLPDLSTWRVEIVGVDVNVAMLEKARAGVYSDWSLRETTPEARRRYFRARGGGVELDPRVRAMVRFEERNLVDDDPELFRPGAFDVVFCRNVTMYFAPEVTRAVIRRFARSITDGGFLFLGHAETLRGLSSDFHLRHTHDTFYYQLREDGGARDAAAPSFVPHVETALDDALLATDTSWVEAIRTASDRIAGLTTSALVTDPMRASVARRPDLARSLELLSHERFDDALEHLRRLPEAHRADPEALLLRAVLLTHGGHVDDAEAVARELLSKDELHAGAHYVMALCCEHRGDLDVAAEHDRSAAYLDPGFAMPHLHLGLLAKRRGDGAQGRTSVARALALLEREDPARILLFGGGFSREALSALCRAELRSEWRST